MKTDDRTIRKEINRLCDEYEDLLIAGKAPEIENFLGVNIPETHHAELFEHLVELDVHYRGQQGIAPEYDELSKRFPKFRDIVDRLRPGNLPDLPDRNSPADTRANHDSDTNPGQTDTSPIANLPLEEKLKSGFGRYEIIRKIGQGGMGSVFLAMDRNLERKVAIKIPEIEPNNKELFDRFVREGKTAAALHHRNICPIFDTGEQDGILFISMAFIEGQSLADWIKREKEFKPKSIAILINKMALALYHAHQAGIIHRDLKPSNIMIDKSGEPVLMDFGLARREVMTESAMLTQSGTIIGTPAYMAPEQIRGGDAVNRLADVYALGVILYQLLSGNLPFKGNLMSVLSQIHLDEPVAPREIKPDADPQLEAICLKAMNKTPEKRFQSMKDLSAALLEYLSNRKSPASMKQTHQPARSLEIESQATDSTNIGGSTLVPSFAADIDQAASPSKSSAEIPPQPVIQTRKHSQKSAATPNRLYHWVIGLTLGIAIILTSLILLIPAKGGTIRVEILDPEIVAKLESNGLMISFDDNTKPIKVREGEEQFLILTRGDEEFRTDSFVLSRGRETRLKIDFVKGKLVAFRDGKPWGSQPVNKTNIIQNKQILAPKTNTDQAVSTTKLELVRDLPFFDCLKDNTQLGLTDGRAFRAMPMDRLEEVQPKIKHIFTVGLTREKLVMILDTFPQVEYLRISEPKLSPSDYELLANTKVTQLAVHPPFGEKLPDAHVAAIGYLTQLTSLALDGISDDEMRHLTRLEDIEKLIFHFCRFQGHGFKHIQRLNKLSSLNIGKAVIGERNTILREVSNIPSLRYLFFPITEDLDLTLIRKLPKLFKLSLNMLDHEVELPDVTPLLDLKELRILILPYKHAQHFDVLNRMTWIETINQLPRDAFFAEQKKLTR